MFEREKNYVFPREWCEKLIIWKILADSRSLITPVEPATDTSIYSLTRALWVREDALVARDTMKYAATFFKIILVCAGETYE